MVTFSRGDILWVDLHGASGSEKQGVRPCLVVQNDRLNRNAPFTLVMTITDAKAYRGIPEQVRIPASEMGQGGKDSVVSAAEIRQVDKSRIDASRGVCAHLSPERMAQVASALRAALAIE